MSRTMINKIKLILVAGLVAVCCFWVGIVSFAKAEPTFTSLDDIQTFQVTDASLIVEGDDGINGLEFKATMSADEYEGLMNAGFKSVETGLVIMPGYIAMPDANGMPAFADEVTMFGLGGQKLYDWAEYDEEVGEYVYNGTLTRVININANEWVNEGDVYAYTGAIVDLYDHNENVCFVANAYVKTTDVADVVDYKFTSNEYGTSVAIELESEYANMTDDQKAWVDTNWTRFETIEEDLIVYDVTGQDSVTLMQIIAMNVSEEANIIMGMAMPDDAIATDNNGNVIDMMTQETMGGTIDLTDTDNIRMYTVEYKLGDTVLYRRAIDLRSNIAPFLWNDEISKSSVAAIDFRGADKVRTDYYSLNKGNPTEETIDGKDYVSFTASGDNGTWFSWKPLHDKSYYEGFADIGVSLSATLKVDASSMVDPADKDGVLNQTSIFGVDGPTAIKATETFTGTTTLDEILTNWDSRVGCEWEKTWGTRLPVGMVYVYNVHNGGKVSVGDFKVVVDTSADAVKDGDILVKLDDVADLTGLNLSSYISEEGKAAINKYAQFGVTYEMKGYSIADTIAVTDLTKVDVENAKRAAYILNAKVGDSVLYTARIDLYNTTDAVVWAESLTENNVIVQYGVYTTGRATPKGEYDYEIVTATTENPVEGKTAGQFIKLESEVSQNILVNVLPLHTQDYYREVVGNKNFVLYFKLFESDTAYMSGLGMNGIQNYGMYNVFSNYRAGGNLANTWENFVMSLDNYLICEDADATYTGAYFDLSKVGTVGTKDGCMMQVEVQTASADGKFLAYIGDFQITTGYETLMTTTTAAANSTSVHTTNLAVDLEGASTYDLRGIFNEISKAKYDYYISVVGVDNNGRGGNPPIYWKVTFGDGSTINVVANAVDDPATILDLTKEVAEGVTVADKLNANSTITILAYAPNIAANGLASHPTYLASVKIDFSNVPTLTPAE